MLNLLFFFCGDFNLPFIRWPDNDQRAAAPDRYLMGSDKAAAVTNQPKNLIGLQMNTFICSISYEVSQKYRII